MGGDRFILAQISDTHVRADDGGANAAALKRALGQAREYRADAILLTGDLANDEGEAEYAALAEALADAPAPLYLLPGNHDHRARLRAAFPSHGYLPPEGPLSYVVEDFPVRIVAVDQIVPGATHGAFTGELAAWLDAALRQAPDAPTLVALHHPPFLSHDRLFDRIGLHQSKAFAAVIARHQQVIRIVCGHHHRAITGQAAHAPVISAPSTAFVYGLALHEDQPVAPKTNEQPGWMLHAWTKGGGMASIVMGL